MAIHSTLILAVAAASLTISAAAFANQHDKAPIVAKTDAPAAASKASQQDPHAAHKTHKGKNAEEKKDAVPAEAK